MALESTLESQGYLRRPGAREQQQDAGFWLSCALPVRCRGLEGRRSSWPDPAGLLFLGSPCRQACLLWKSPSLGREEACWPGGQERGQAGAATKSSGVKWKWGGGLGGSSGD